MSNDRAAGLTVADVADEIEEQTAREKLRELQAAHNMQQNLLALEMRHGTTEFQKLRRVVEGHTTLLTELRDLLAKLVQLNANGHSH
jgi:hypothetical protein